MMARFLWVLLLPMLLMHSGSLAMNLGAANESSPRVMVALNYPSIQIGPFSWRYFRVRFYPVKQNITRYNRTLGPPSPLPWLVEVPQAFAELSISLTRKWTGEHIGSPEAKMPLVCFRFGSPPLPESVFDSPQAAAMAAGMSENLSGSGKCAWFHANSSVSLTNMQILAGVWYVGVFSDPQPSRFQAKVITRGSIFTFGIHFTVFGCKSPNLRGQNCEVVIKPLWYQTSTFDLNSHSRRKFNLTEGVNDLTKQAGEEEEEAWSSLMLEHAGPKTWKYYALEVVDFSLKLSARASTAEEINGTIFVKYGVLPTENDKGTPLGLSPVRISAPRRGLWFIAVHNLDETTPLDFDLYWHVESCSYGGAEGSCALATNSMERVLVEDANESPFNSFYGPAREESLLYSPWFLLSNVTHVGNETSGSNWSYFFIEVPRGASGAVLSVQLRHLIKATVNVYARWEGFASPETFDVSAMNVGGKQGMELSLDLVYPAEGVWCIGVHQAKRLNSVVEDIIITPHHHGRIIGIWAMFVLSWKKLWTQETPSLIHDMNQSLSHMRHSPDVQMLISVHGCVNECSGQGHCTTSYESSRLHYYSYCHCDAAHGGIDCAVPLVRPREETLHLWLLIGSNLAALFPSVWAMQHQAYSEWVSYLASGLASGFYHSCDAGGWCALTYDTLQFLDFWLAFLVIVVTCLYVASLKQDVKALAHIGTAIITAAITKENATSAWNILAVGLMGMAGLMFGLSLECWRLRLIPSWFSAVCPAPPIISVETIYHRGEQLLGCIRARFRWFYLAAGLGILIAAGMSWVLEKPKTYWLWHSLWHVGIYSSAFFILFSTTKAPDTRSEPSSPPSDAEASPMLRDTHVELDAFASARTRED